MHNLAVYRLHISDYSHPNFIENEKKAIETNNIKYYYNETPCDEEQIILISTSNINPYNIPDDILKRTSLLIHPNSGFDNLITWAQEVKFPTLLGHQIRAHAVSEYVLSTIFKHFTSIENDSSWQRKWQRKRIKDLNIQLIGFGHVGKIICESLKGLNIVPWVFDPYLNYNELFLEKADVIILVPALSKTSLHFLNKENFKSLKSNVLIINPARGKLIKESDLIEFLNNNPESFTYLDVFEQEPNDFSQFKNLKNIITTSHKAGVYQNLDKDIIDFTSHMVREFLYNKNFMNQYKNLFLTEQNWVNHEH